MEGKLKESGGYLGWHEQLLTEKQDLPVTIATLVLPTLVCFCVYGLFLQRSSCRRKKNYQVKSCTVCYQVQPQGHVIENGL